MGHIEQQQSLKAPAGALPRPRYEAGNFLAARDLLAEQRYRSQRMRRHNRYLHGWGVMFGLQVVPARDTHRPWALQICPGYAISCCGDEIIVPAPTVVDVRDYLWTRPDDSGQPAYVAYVGIRYAEEDVRPIPTTNPSCGCDDPIYQPSRIRDGFQVDVLWTLPDGGQAEAFDPCTQQSAPCPECPDSPYVILASITLPLSESAAISHQNINNSGS